MRVFFPDEAERLNFATLRFLDKELLIKLQAMQKVIDSNLSDGDKLFLVELMNTYASAFSALW